MPQQERAMPQQERAMPQDTPAAHEPRAEGLVLPAPGFPSSEDAVSAWFAQRYHRAPADRELGIIINAMTERDAQSPRTGPASVTQDPAPVTQDPAPATHEEQKHGHVVRPHVE
jgi:hypothetical protein